MTAAEGASLPLALLARDAQKMRAAAELLNAWQIAPHDLWCGALLGRGGQAEVFGGRWQGLPVAIKKQRAEHRITPAAQRSMEQTVRRPNPNPNPNLDHDSTPTPTPNPNPNPSPNPDHDSYPNRYGARYAR